MTIEGLQAKVALSVSHQGGTKMITATPPPGELDLKPGDPAVALIKAAEVMIVSP